MNYDAVVGYCLKNGVLWEDPDFPAEQSSVFYHQTPPFSFRWKRPHEIASSPTFVSDHFEIDHGRLGDHWLSSCFGCLRTAEGLLYRVVPADQGFDDRHSYAGVFRFRVWWCGEWKEVLVDDRLPAISNKLIFIHAKGLSSPFWPALLQKAYAKLHGSYEALKYGTTLDGLSDLTGGISESISLKASGDAMATLQLLLKMTTIVTAKAEKNENDAEVDAEVRSSTSLVRVFGLRKLEAIQVRLKALDAEDDDGEFWMPEVDFSRTFTHLEAVHLDADTARDEPTLAGKSAWSMRLYQGRWQRGVTAGGCRNNFETFHMNPRLSMSLLDPDEVVIALNQHTAVDPKVIGFTGYPLPAPAPTASSSSSKSSTSSNEGVGGNQRSSPTSHSSSLGNSESSVLGKSYFRSKKSLLNSQYTNSKQVSLRVSLGSGQIVVLPTTFEPGEECAFTFRVFSRSSSSSNVRMRIVDASPAVVGTIFTRAARPPHHHNHPKEELITNSSSSNSNNKNSAKDFRQYEPIFMQMSEDKRTVNAFELQDLLEACLPNDYIKGCASIEVCRQIVASFDRSGLGRITFVSFKDLMCSLKVWHNVFKNWTKEKSGILKSERLKDALLEVGFQLNTVILSTIMFRYMRKDGTLRFGDFVAIILGLSFAFEAFDKKDSLNNGCVKVGKTEWLKVALTC